jgi:hypothetical protein
MYVVSYHACILTLRAFPFPKNFSDVTCPNLKHTLVKLNSFKAIAHIIWYDPPSPPSSHLLSCSLSGAPSSASPPLILLLPVYLTLSYIHGSNRPYNTDQNTYSRKRMSYQFKACFQLTGLLPNQNVYHL